MYKRINSEDNFPKGNSSQPLTIRHGVATLETQERSWFSVVSRPAWSVLQKYLPGLSQTFPFADWGSEQCKANLDTRNSLMGQLDDILPTTNHPPHFNVTYVHFRHGNAEFVPSSGPESLSFITSDSLGELGIQNTDVKELKVRQQQPVGYFTSARNFLSQFLFNVVSPQEIKRAEHVKVHVGDVWSTGVVATRPTNNLGEFLGADDSVQHLLSNLSRTTDATDGKSQHCGDYHSSDHCQPPQCSAAAAVAKPTELFVHGDDRGSMHNESSGFPCHKESTDNESLHMPRPQSLPNSDQLPLDQCSTYDPLLSARTAIACSEVAVLTPDQDNGYSSLEEEHPNSRLHKMRFLSEGPEMLEIDRPIVSQGESTGCETGREGSLEHAEGLCSETERQQEQEESKEEAEESAAPEQAEPLPHLSIPQCQNKAIAYIMGRPVSGESESEEKSEDDSDWDSDDDDDDDGFDSEGSSHSSDSEDLDDSDSEDGERDSDTEEADSETERLWNSLCQNRDPYNPRNFTAPIRTAPRSTGAAEALVSVSPADCAPSPFSSSPSSPSPLLSLEDESGEEACGVNEAENLRLWNSFSCTADPYSLFHFQAPLRTRETARGRNKKELPPDLPRYKREEAEERLDSGFSELAPSLGKTDVKCTRLKKVRFLEEVEEFYASSDEDRRGPWEEFARDRCRFQRRIQEVEETISFCLDPSFRLVVFQRLSHSS
ncbi:uncharacterized protein ppp1r15b [Chanos chanos]|uniref:Uncharacterized protein ppp1r15b n=1 Tax=Chanos chanos TaxID=29144 RepID=A0A6J2VJZ5_CHACN|nr:protein phosphatase 1 regulatory subunit 15B [Chanos chanos]